MTVYNYDPIPVYGQVGGLVRIGARASATFPVTDLAGAPVTVVQGGVTQAGFVTSDGSGLLPSFSTVDVKPVKVAFTPGLAVTVQPREGAGVGELTVANGTSVTLPAGDTVGSMRGFVVTAPTVINGVSCTVGVWVFVKNATAWVGYAAGGGAAGDTTAPTAGVLSVTGVTESSIALSVAGAVDEKALSATPYAFSKDNGATWTAYQAGPTYSFTGLTSSTSYTLRHRVQDAAGNVTVGAAVVQATPAQQVWVSRAAWNFTAADTTATNGLAPSSGSGVTLTAPATNTGLTPPLYFDVMGNRLHQRADGGAYYYTLVKTTTESAGIAIQMDSVLASTSGLILDVGTISSGGNSVGFQISYLGAITAHHSAQGSTTYTAAPGAPTTVPKTATLRAEFTPGGSNNGCTGKLFVDGTLYGTIASTGWTWQGKHVFFVLNANQVDSYLDNLTVDGLTTA